MSGVLLSALDGSNPLAFLTALGALRLGFGVYGPQASLSWQRAEGCWRPVLKGCGDNEQEVAKCLMGGAWAPVEAFQRLGKNITVEPETFRQFAREAQSGAVAGDRRAADFAAAFGSEICVDEKKGRIEYSDLCFITGSGHQDFLGTMQKLGDCTTKEHLLDALFGNWKQDGGLSMRWDPSDAAEYALQWDDPGPKGARAVWGANRLACEALPLFPAVSDGESLVTTGFRWEKSEGSFTWPIWTAPISVDTVRSLLALEYLQRKAPEREYLSAIGVVEVYRSRRVRIGQGANFKVSFRPAEVV